MLSVKGHLQEWLQTPPTTGRFTARALQVVEEEESLNEFSSKEQVATCASLLRSCLDGRDGLLIHDRIVRQRLESTAPLPSLLILMYSNCAAIHEAHACLAVLPRHQQNVFSWNFLFKALARKKHCPKSFLLYAEMAKHGVIPNRITILNMLDACSGDPTHLLISQVHALIVEHGFDTDVVIGTALLNIYGKVGGLQEAARVFDGMAEKDAVTWTSMILKYVQHGQHRLAIQLFEEMHLAGAMPDRVTYMAALSACSVSSALFRGREVHSAILMGGLEDNMALGSTLVNMYGKCHSFGDAKNMFDQLNEKNEVTWNALIGAYSQNGAATDCLHRMQLEGVLPNRETFVSFLGGCNNLEALKEGLMAHAQLQGNGSGFDITVENILINMYGKCSSIEHARKVFDKLLNPDVVSWTIMIMVYAQHGEFWVALRLFVNMHSSGTTPNGYTFVNIISVCTNHVMVIEGRSLHSYVYEKGFESNDKINNALLNMYVKLGSIEDAQYMFDRLQLQDAISWTAMIAGLSEQCKTAKALELFSTMQNEGVQPNEVTYINILTACADQSALDEGRWVHGCLIEHGLEFNVSVGNALINMYGKSGGAKDAHHLFVSMPEVDLISWNTLLIVFGLCGRGIEAVCLFDDMKFAQTVPDNITFSSVLAACSHTGLVEESWRLFMSLEEDHGIFPVGDHFVCMVDILGRVGHVEEASVLISLMPLKPTILVFMALIGACQHRAEMEVGEFAAKSLHELDPENTASYVVLSNIVAAVGGDLASNMQWSSA